MLAENAGTPAYTPLIWLLSISFVIMLLYNLLSEQKRSMAEPLLPMLQLALCIPIQYLDVSGDNLFLSIIAGFSAIKPVVRADIALEPRVVSPGGMHHDALRDNGFARFVAGVVCQNEFMQVHLLVLLI